MIRWSRIYKEFAIALDGLRKGLLEIAITMSENTRIAKLLYKICELENRLDKLYVNTGKTIHELHDRPYDEILNNEEIKEYINKVKTIQSDIHKIEKEITLLREEGLKSKLEELKKYMRQGGYTVEELIMEKDSEVIGKYIGELKLPHGVNIIAIIHNGIFNIPQANIKLTEGDRVFILGSIDAAKEVATLFSVSEKIT